MPSCFGVFVVVMRTKQCHRAQVKQSNEAGGDPPSHMIRRQILLPRIFVNNPGVPRRPRRGEAAKHDLMNKP